MLTESDTRNISKEILFEKFLKPKLDKINSNFNSNSNSNSNSSGTTFKKDNFNSLSSQKIFTGTKASMTYSKNTNNRYSQNGQNNQNYLNQEAKNSLRESFDLFEGGFFNTTYKRNLMNPYSNSKSSAVSKTIVDDVIKRKTAPKPRNGKVQTYLSNNAEQRLTQRKFNNARKILGSQNGSI